ncbi:AzlC family ABC transporter permease [Microvirga pudoricolor]|uniref:AzlC family ABC transporter permease n=1 Tax=Microvirga pudoricolor TaxID=2778729 RepID=UPI00194F57A3|nr:AzlC family ABC transporter permease [Microvirga pudoricolor]MBM6596709.1 AzlC family ABC transporter permease [Microvirga pudoricolor]
MRFLSHHPLTLDGCRRGARMSLAAFPGFIVFSMAFGAAASQKGLTLGQVLGLSGFVYAGASQMVGLEIWQQVWSPSTILTIATVTAVINARLILLGVTVQPWLAREPKPLSAVMLFFLVEANWLYGTRYYQEGGRDLGVFIGSGLTLWLIWFLSTFMGYFAGALVPEPRRFGLDFVMPVFFCCLLVPLWKGPRRALPWLAAGVASYLTHVLVPGYAFIIAGALAGVVTGMILDE